MRSLLPLLALTAVASGPVLGQGEKNPLEPLGALVGGTWVAEGTWSSGAEIRQEIVYEWGLDEKVLKTRLYGIVNPETREFGLRNEGVRAWDPDLGAIRFWEFDVFGGITEGICHVEPGTFYFAYEYEVGEILRSLRDVWIRIDDDTYDFKVVMLENGSWDTELIAMRFLRTD